MWKVPPEGARHSRTWMAWPWDGRVWNRVPGTNLHLCQQAIDKLVRAILNYEQVALLARECDAASLERRFKRSSNDRHHVEIVIAKYNDIWVRDTLPTFAANDQSLAAINWNFNGWGQRVRPYANYGDDVRICDTVAAFSGAKIIDSGIVAEGGAFAFDEGCLVLTTRSVLFDELRNADRKKADLEEAIARVTGRQRVCWLPGDRNEPITTGHVDSLIAFTGKGVALANWVSNEMSPEFDVCDYNIQSLQTWVKDEDYKLEVIRVPGSTYSDANYHCFSYVNFAQVNGAIIVPKYGMDNEDQYARSLIAESFNNELDVECIDATAFGLAGGGIHCVTQQQPLI